ncbi:hypothetical protein T01_10810, partial [Trichinella spiralis]
MTAIPLHNQSGIPSRHNHHLPSVVKPIRNPCTNPSVINTRYPPVPHPAISVHPLSTHSTILSE